MDVFALQKQAALALLSGNYGNSDRAAQFLGRIANRPRPLSEKQEAWLCHLLSKAGLPQVAEAATDAGQ